MSAVGPRLRWYPTVDCHGPVRGGFRQVSELGGASSAYRSCVPGVVLAIFRRLSRCGSASEGRAPPGFWDRRVQMLLRLCGLFALMRSAEASSSRALPSTGSICGSGRCGDTGRHLFRRQSFAGISAFWRLASSRIGLVRTMVFTHVPSNVLLILVPLMPLPWRTVCCRFSISNGCPPAVYIWRVPPRNGRWDTGARTTGAAIALLRLCCRPP